jgi:hypothetical protein
LAHNFFDSHPNNFYGADPFQRGPSMDDPNAASPNVNTVVIRNSKIRTFVTGMQFSVTDSIGLSGPSDKERDPDNGNPYPEVPENLNPHKDESLETAVGAVDLASGFLAGQTHALTQMHEFAFVYNNGTGEFYVLDVSPLKAVPPGSAQYLPPDQALAVVRDIFSQNDMVVSRNSEHPPKGTK